MNKIERFLNKITYWKMISGLLFVFILITYFTLDFFFKGNGKRIIPENGLGDTVFLVILTMGSIFSVIVCTMVTLGSMSRRFWVMSSIIEKKIHEAKTITDLDLIYKNDFLNLTNLSVGYPHSKEIRRLKSKIKSKYQFVDDE